MIRESREAESVLRNIDKENQSYFYASQWSMIDALNLKPLGIG